MADINRIAKYLTPSPRFARSIHLERDFADSTALDQYVVTEKVDQLCRRFSTAFREGSTERAWRITGDYGTGKSCFALALARLCSNQARPVPKSLSSLAKSLAAANALPVLVTGARESISAAIIRALIKSFDQARSHRRPALLSRASQVLKHASPADRDRYAIEALEEANKCIGRRRQANGILLILDELGKALEFATQHPNEQDITFLQSLAESASRSGDRPLVILGILHQGFATYADRMEATDQREWDKIGGRFEELFFDQPLEQLVELAASALGVSVRRLPASVVKLAKANMEKAIELGWFGAIADKHSLIQKAPAIYPLQPMLLPVLVRFFSRFGQNERSLFTFLNSTDPSAVRSFADSRYAGDGFFGIHHLYDYVRASIGHRIHTRTLSSRWNQIESVISACLSDNDKESSILKIVGMLNMLDDQKMYPTEEVIDLATSQTCLTSRQSASTVINALRTKKHVLYQRGSAGGYCLWPHTSVNLELKYVEAERAIRQADHIVEAIRQNVEDRPIVARRHYVQTGNLRHFDLVYVTADQFKSTIEKWHSDSADGVVFVPLCSTKADQKSVIDSIGSLHLGRRSNVLVAVPEPLNGFAGLVTELRRWEWLRTNVHELNGDKYASEEVSRQIASAHAVLRDRTNNVLNVRLFRESNCMRWFYKGKLVELNSSRELSTIISSICDKVFSSSPIIKNELLNRRKLSSAAAAARMRLIERVFNNASEALLGMDATKRPPEMSMYLSALKNANLHVKGRNGCRIQLPAPDQDTCNLIPTFDRVREILTQQEGGRVNVADLFAELRKPPIGARDGVLPLLVAVFCVAEFQHVAMYEDGSFLQDIGEPEFARLAKAPETFALQYCRLSGVRSEVFNQLLALVESNVDSSRAPDLLDVVKPLCQFVATLPDYSRNSTELGKTSLGVRDALLNATEPASLLFDDLPKACGLPSIHLRTRAASDGVKKYIKSLRRALGELRSAYPTLLNRIEKLIADSFQESATHETLRDSLQQKASNLGLHITEPTLKAFCLRLADSALPRDAWLESIGSLVLAKPPRRWHDRDESAFSETLVDLVSRFQRTAALAFAKSHKSDRHSVRLSILQANGIEESQIIDMTPSDEFEAVRMQMESIFETNPRQARAVASQILLKQMTTSS
jgi:hypothetical protein